jgi:hypothetical protein
MSDQSSPLAGLTGEQADDAIARLATKIDQQDQSLRAAKAHLKEMRAARKALAEPEPAGNGVAAHAESAQITAEGSDAG